MLHDPAEVETSTENASMSLDGGRLVEDRGGGLPNEPIEAVVLLEGRVVSSARPPLATALRDAAAPLRGGPAVSPAARVLYVMRHGQSLSNAAKLAGGDTTGVAFTDSPLSELGKQQAVRVPALAAHASP